MAEGNQIEPRVGVYNYHNFNSGINMYESVARTILTNPENTSTLGVAFAYNVDFDDVYGHIKTRRGSQVKGGQLSQSGKVRGVFSLRSFGTSTPLAALDTGGTVDMYYYNGSWVKSAGWQNQTDNIHRFAQMNNTVFVVNGADEMQETANGDTFSQTNSLTGVSNLQYITRYRGRILAMDGKATVFFSSIVDPDTSPFITWPNENFITINPEDGGYASGFAEVDGILLVFKNNGYYRVDITSSSVQPDNLYQVGAVSQEAIAVGRGMCFFYSGKAVYVTNGTDHPQEISRPVRDLIRRISSYDNVVMTANEEFMYMACGNITTADNTTYANVVLRYSINNDAWTLFSYPFPIYSMFYIENKTEFIVGSQDYVYNIEVDSPTDLGNGISFSVRLNDFDANDRSQQKSILKRLTVFTRDNTSSQITIIPVINTRETQKLTRPIVQDISIHSINPSLNGHYFKIYWEGTSYDKRTIFEGATFNYKYLRGREDSHNRI